MFLNDVAVKAKEEIEKRDPSKADDREFTRQVEKLITIVGQILGESMIQMISLNVGSPDIEESAYAETLEAIGQTAASNLIDLSIRLDHSESYPFNQIKTLYKQYEDNRYAQLILRDLVIANMYVFDVGKDMRQRVLDTLDAGKAREGMMAQGGKRFKAKILEPANRRKKRAAKASTRITGVVTPPSIPGRRRRMLR